MVNKIDVTPNFFCFLFIQINGTETFNSLSISSYIYYLKQHWTITTDGALKLLLVPPFFVFFSNKVSTLSNFASFLYTQWRLCSSNLLCWSLYIRCNREKNTDIKKQSYMVYQQLLLPVTNDEPQLFHNGMLMVI
jgi:hypothetical protein